MSHHGEWEHALGLTARSRALYDGLDRPWDQAANALFAARAAISAGDRGRAAEARDQVQHWLRIVDDPWLHVRRDAMLGELARVEHRFDDAVEHIGRAAETSRRLGFLQTEAYQLSSLGRAQCQAGDYEAGAATLELAIDKAEAIGDVRLAALARVHLGRVLRALGRVGRGARRARSRGGVAPRAGGGEQAVLGDCLLAASTPRIGTARRRASGSRRSSTPPAATTTPPSRSSPSTRWRGWLPRRATRRGPRPLRAADGAWRSPRTSSPSAIGPTPRGQAARLTCVAALVDTTNASSPPMTIAMPTTCRSFTTSPSSRNDHTTASAG